MPSIPIHLFPSIYSIESVHTAPFIFIFFVGKIWEECPVRVVVVPVLAGVDEKRGKRGGSKKQRNEWMDGMEWNGVLICIGFYYISIVDTCTYMCVCMCVYL